MRAIALLLMIFVAAPAAASDLWWVFLTKGPKREEVKDPEALKTWQAQHIGNLERMWNEGVAALAGPLGDDGFIRGIVVMRATSRDELVDQFASDPLVASGRLAVDALRWSGSVDGLGKPVEPMSLQQATLAILKKGPSWTEGAALDPARLVRWQQEGRLVLAGAVQDRRDEQAILLFREPDAAVVRSLLGADAAVSSGRLTVETHPQYVAKGMLGEDPNGSGREHLEP